MVWRQGCWLAQALDWLGAAAGRRRLGLRCWAETGTELLCGADVVLRACAELAEEVSESARSTAGEARSLRSEGLSE